MAMVGPAKGTRRISRKMMKMGCQDCGVCGACRHDQEGCPNYPSVVIEGLEMAHFNKVR